MNSKDTEFSSLIDVLRFWATKEPKRTSFTHLIDESHEVHLTFGELDRRAQAIAGNLQGKGYEGARALLLYQSGLDYISAVFGCMYAGVTLVPLFPPRLNQSLERVAAIAENSNAALGLISQSINARIGAKIANHPSLKAMSWLQHDQLIEETDWKPPLIKPQTLAILQYTSGSTADPKGVQISHNNLLVNVQMFTEGWKTTEDAVIVNWVPPYHDMGLIANIMHAVYAGAKCILMSPSWVGQQPLRWLRAMSKHRGTLSGGPNYMYNALLEPMSALDPGELDLSSWKVAFNGSEPVSPDTVEKFTNAAIRFGFKASNYFPGYGLAEATLCVTGPRRTGEPPLIVNLDKHDLANRVVSFTEALDSMVRVIGCGYPLRDQRVVIVDPETREQCPPHRIGEIWISGENVTMGYWRNENATEETYSGYLKTGNEGPFLRTGDLGFLHAGQLFVTGRIKELIIIRGENHFPQDIERSCQASHPSLSPGSGVAFSLNADDGEKLVIVQEVKRTERKKLDAQSVIDSIRTAVARDHGLRAHSVVLINPGTLPKTLSGKLMRGACRELFLNKALDVIGERTVPLT